MKKLILLPIFLLALIGCDKETGEVICSSAEFIFVNQAGDDIFNPNTTDHLEISDFELFTPDSVIELNFYTDTINGINHFQIGINGRAEKEGVTYLKFGNITTDTIFSKFKEKGNSLFISELYYNGKLIEKNDGVTECGTKVHEITVLGK